jgi:hypothetical protein
LVHKSKNAIIIIINPTIWSFVLNFACKYVILTVSFNREVFNIMGNDSFLNEQEEQSTPAVYGYAWIPEEENDKDDNSFGIQDQKLKAAGAEIIYTDVYTCATSPRPNLERLMAVMKSGDTLIVTKLDRIARSVLEGSKLIKNIVERGIAVRVLNLGNRALDQSPEGILMIDTMYSFVDLEQELLSYNLFGKNSPQ